MDLGTLSAVLIVSGLVLLFFSTRARIIIRRYDKIEEQRKAGTYHEPSAEDEERRMRDYYLSTALYEYGRRQEEMRHHK